MNEHVFQIAADYAEASRPHISEWFGHRVFPVVSAHPTALGDQVRQRCPFLSLALGEDTTCSKTLQNPNSAGVCTISSASNGRRQDWLVCPIRALDHALLEEMVRRLYGVAAADPIRVAPAVLLSDEARRADLLEAMTREGAQAFIYFQSKLGGEVGLAKTAGSPEMSYDVTIVELLRDGPEAVFVGGAAPGAGIRLGKYGVVEVQTADTHGSYKHAVGALKAALDLHPRQFPDQLALNPEWARRRMEGPNVSNVFKRTFYQVAFKFQATKRDTSVGCVLALPRPVWDSWQPFLGAPVLHQHGDGTWRMLHDTAVEPAGWIYVFDVDETPGPDGRPAPIRVALVIGTDAATLSRAALDIAPANAVGRGGSRDAVVTTLHRRLRAFLPGLH